MDHYKKLYIIGNGFDLHHGLKTSYRDFSIYLREADSDLYDTLDKYVVLESKDQTLWNDFETNLAKVNIEEIIDDHTNYLPNFGSDDFRSGDIEAFPSYMLEYKELLTDHLFEQFKSFIKSVRIMKSAFCYKMCIDKSALFLTFNYTNTLEVLYNIPETNIIYLHNSAIYDSEPVILGHGVDPKNLILKDEDPPAGLSAEELHEWYYDNYDYSYDTGKQNIQQYFEDSFKHTTDIISKYQQIFESLILIKTVYILGHSLSSVDLPYFKKIKDSVTVDCEWHVSYYSDLEKLHHIDTLLLLGIKECYIKPFKMCEIQLNNFQLSLKFT